MTSECPQKVDKKFSILAGGVSLLSFGVSYAHLINRVEKSGQIEGKSSLYVAWGVIATLAVRYLAMPLGRTRAEGFFYTALAFVFSGTPMIVNQLDNYRRQTAGYRRRREQWTNSRQTQ